FCFFALPDAVAALDALTAAGTMPDPRELPPPTGRPGDAVADARVFPSAGLGVFRAGGLHLALGVRVGGALKLHATGPAVLLHDDCGYAAELDGGGLASSWSAHATGTLAPTGGSSAAAFARWSRESPIAAHPVLLRAFFHTAGRFAGPSRWLSRT